MSKAAVKKQHWRSKVQDSFVPLLGSSGELGIAIGGGADYGEFPFVTSAPGGGFTVGDIILEIGGTPVLGMTLGDVRGVLNSCPHPIRIKTVSPGYTLCKDLRLYLSKCFTPGSMDSQFQQVIRENLYLRAVPCTTRKPRDGEISGVDYNFVSIEEFFSLEESGVLLESGKFKASVIFILCIIKASVLYCLNKDVNVMWCDFELVIVLWRDRLAVSSCFTFILIHDKPTSCWLHTYHAGLRDANDHII
uniref:Uncharacterized protein n=1 Tax=Anabas testudineus TaxID=64144 RepID=A0A3Q1JD65_ANATE